MIPTIWHYGKGSDGESEKINQYSVLGWTADTPGIFRAVKLFCMMSLYICQNLECTTQKVNPNVNYGRRLTRMCQFQYIDCKWWSQITSVLGINFFTPQEPLSMLICYISTISVCLKDEPRYHDAYGGEKKTIDRDVLPNLFSLAISKFWLLESIKGS